MRKWLVVALVVAGCTGKSEDLTVRHSFPVVSVDAFTEIRWMCQSWTMDNDKTIYLNQTQMSAGLGWHHSNWFWVPDGFYGGPDGTWDCDDRGFEEVTAALAGGVIFAQSTAVESETQTFSNGAVVEIPPHSRIIGNIHLLNTTAQPFDTQLTLELRGIEESAVAVKLNPAGFFYFPLDIPPATTARFEASCDLSTMDFNVYYFLPHYHQYGTSMTLDAYGSASTLSLYENPTGIGEPFGQGYDPAVSVAGNDGFRIACTYTNPTQNTISYGWADGEMCEALIFTDSESRFLMEVHDGQLLGADGNGVLQNEGTCETATL